MIEVRWRTFLFYRTTAFKEKDKDIDVFGFVLASDIQDIGFREDFIFISLAKRK
jgi:hypothetical protein